MSSRRTAPWSLSLAAAMLLLGTSAAIAEDAVQEETQQVSSTSSRTASSTRSSGRSSSSSTASRSTSRSNPSGTSSASAGDSSRRATSSSRQRAGRSAWRDRSGRHHHYGSHHYYGGYSWGYNYYPRYWGYWYMPWFWGPSVSVYYEPGSSGYRRSDRDLGALDTDISPEKAEIFIDGKYVGVADDFDGFPTYLWLEEGTYDVAAYHPGYRTLTRQVSVYPGLVIDLDHRLEAGESVRPEDLAPKETPIRDERLRRDRERQEEASWRREVEPPVAPPQAYSAGPEASDASGRLRLDIVPGDAAIYLDGRFLGTAEEVGRLHAGLIVEPGEHQLSVVRPGYGEKRRRFTLEPGEELILEVDLDD